MSSAAGRLSSAERQRLLDELGRYIDHQIAKAETRLGEDLATEVQLLHDRITSVHSRALRALTAAITPNGGNSTDV
jgi:hypothetical protein